LVPMDLQLCNLGNHARHQQASGADKRAATRHKPDPHNLHIHNIETLYLGCAILVLVVAFKCGTSAPAEHHPQSVARATQ